MVPAKPTGNTLQERLGAITVDRVVITPSRYLPFAYTEFLIASSFYNCMTTELVKNQTLALSTCYMICLRSLKTNISRIAQLIKEMRLGDYTTLLFNFHTLYEFRFSWL